MRQNRCAIIVWRILTCSRAGWRVLMGEVLMAHFLLELPELPHQAQTSLSIRKCKCALALLSMLHLRQPSSNVLLTDVCTHFWCAYETMFECTLLCKGRYLCASARMCVELSRDQHTCGWVFITAGLSDGLDRGRPLFIVISIHLISPRFTGQRRPPKTPRSCWRERTHACG